MYIYLYVYRQCSAIIVLIVVSFLMYLFVYILCCPWDKIKININNSNNENNVPSQNKILVLDNKVLVLVLEGKVLIVEEKVLVLVLPWKLLEDRLDLGFEDVLVLKKCLDYITDLNRVHCSLISMNSHWTFWVVQFLQNRQNIWPNI